jgi:hypothetical protein
MLVEAVWTKPYLAYLIRGELPEDTIHHRLILRRSKAFTIIQESFISAAPQEFSNGA